MIFDNRKMIVEVDGQLTERPIDHYGNNDEFGFMPVPMLRDDEIAVHVIGKDHPVIIKGQHS